MVEVENRPKLCTACSEEVADGMIIKDGQSQSRIHQKVKLGTFIVESSKVALFAPKNLVVNSKVWLRIWE